MGEDVADEPVVSAAAGPDVAVEAGKIGAVVVMVSEVAIVVAEAVVVMGAGEEVTMSVVEAAGVAVAVAAVAVAVKAIAAVVEVAAEEEVVSRAACLAEFGMVSVGAILIGFGL